MGLIVDNFAGGGGASTGIKLALGRDVDLAVNHSPQAMHAAGHHTFQVLTKRAERMASYFTATPVELLQRWSVAVALIVGFFAVEFIR